MEEQEVAEAIIVVGPFLWKCVNCDILMSRQHSIDYHLNNSHYSRLRPRDISESKENITGCKIPSCSCQKLPVPTRETNKQKKSSVPEQRLGSENERNKIGEDKEKTLISSEQLMGSEVDTSKDSVLCDNILKEKSSDSDQLIGESELLETTLYVENRTNSGSDLTFKSEEVMVNGGAEHGKISLETSLVKGYVMPNTGTVTDSSFLFLDNDNIVNNEELSVRKSRRSNKGRNPMYMEYEMNNS